MSDLQRLSVRASENRGLYPAVIVSPGAPASAPERADIEARLVTLAHNLETSPTLWRVDPSNGDVTIPDFSVAEVAASLSGS